MCGIYGIISTDNSAEANQWKRGVMDKLAVITEIRGTDATGIAYFDPKGTLRVAKQPVKASEFIKTQDYLEAVEDFPDIIIGHNRAKTVGHESNAMNNHPITSKTTGIAMIHNGGIANHSMWRNRDESGFNFMLDEFDGEVDSEVLVRMLDTMLHIPRAEDGRTIDPDQVFATPKEQWSRGVDMLTAIQDTTFNLDGGQACVLLDPEEPDAVYFWKIKNPMSMAYVPQYKAIVFASTEDILKRSLEDERNEHFFNFFWRRETTRQVEYIMNNMPDNNACQIIINYDAEDKEDLFEFSLCALKPNGAKALLKPFTVPDTNQVPFNVAKTASAVAKTN